MTQVRTPAGSGAGTGTGAEQTGSSSTTLNAPQALTFAEIPGLINTMADGLVHYEIKDGTLFSGTVELTSSDFVWTFTAADNGRIVGIEYSNGSVACDGTNGWELAFVNVDNSNASVAYFGFGSNTEAAKGTDNDVAVAADVTVQVSNSLTATTARFDKGDRISLTADRDGTTVVGMFRVLVSYEAEGYTA